MLFQNRGGLFCLIIDACVDAIQFNQQHGLRINRQSSREYAGFDRANDRVVHHFQSGRQHTGGNDCRHGAARVVNVSEIRKQRTHCGWNRRELDSCFGGDPEGSFRTNKDSQEIITGCVDIEIHDRAVGQNHARTDYVISSGPIFQAMNATGVFSDVTANGARRLAGRIGHVIKAIRCDGA